MKLTYKFAILHSINFILAIIGAMSLKGLWVGAWLFVVGVLEFIQLWLIFIHPVDVLISSPNFEFTKSLGLKEFDTVAQMLNSLSSDLDTQTEARRAATYLSEHDGLTGCYNRLALNAHEIQYEECDSLYVLMFDVNNLKRMNDEHGHKAGDALIRSAVEQLKYWVSYGNLYRIGGDEFLVVVKNKTEAECTELLDNWNGCNVILNRIDDGFCCVLAYGAAYGKDLSKLMKVADERMYANKAKVKAEFGEEMR